MFLDYTDEQLALRKELREYFDRLLTPEVRAEMGHPGEGNPLFRTIVRQCAQFDEEVARIVGTAE